MKKLTPTAILHLRGAFDAHPERLRDRANEPRPTKPIGPAPSWMNPEQRSAFREIARRAYPGVLASGDVFALELAAVLLAQMRRDPASMSAAKMGRLQALLGSMGLTPADRSRVSAAPLQPRKASNGFKF